MLPIGAKEGKKQAPRYSFTEDIMKKKTKKTKKKIKKRRNY